MQIDDANKRNETFFEEVKYFNQQQLTSPTNRKDGKNILSPQEI